MQLDENERRLRQLEERVLARHTQTMTWILTAVGTVMSLAAILVTLLAFMSRSETAQEMRDNRQQFEVERAELENRFDKMSSNLQQQFNTLAGDALKKPKVEILVRNGPLTNQVLHLIRNVSPIYPLTIKNVGQKRTEPLSIYLYSSQMLSIDPNSNWESDSSDDAKYPVKYRLSVRPGSVSTFGLAPEESWALSDDPFAAQELYWNLPTNSVSCKFVIFYGGENPAEGHFELKDGP